MPIYEYRRPDGTTFEIQQAFSDETLTHDPDTGVAVQRVLHAPAVHFKGKGFYNTDYGTRKRQRETAAAAEGSSSSSEGSSKSDSAGSSASDSGSSSTESGSSGSDAKKSEKAKDSGAKQSTKSAKDAKPVAAKS
jgi:putative FmdB family regulatory protein